jgi:hypothetical protein
MSARQLGLPAHISALVFFIPRESGEFHCLVNEMSTRLSPVILKVRPRADRADRRFTIERKIDTVAMNLRQMERSTFKFANVDDFDGEYTLLTRGVESVLTRKRAERKTSQKRHSANRDRSNEDNANYCNRRHEAAPQS